MNRKTTPILVALVVLMSLLAYFSERARTHTTAQSAPTTEGATVLSVRSGDITSIRMKRDYWNSFRLARSPEGVWRLTEPSNEAASEAGVTRLLNALESLPAISVINLPADDTERHRQYGLWKPAIEITVGTTEGDQTLLVGSSTADGKGVYCARLGKDGVFVTSAEAVQVLSQDLSAYRQEKNASQP